MGRSCKDNSKRIKYSKIGENRHYKNKATIDLMKILW